MIQIIVGDKSMLFAECFANMLNHEKDISVNSVTNCTEKIKQEISEGKVDIVIAEPEMLIDVVDNFNKVIFIVLSTEINLKTEVVKKLIDKGVRGYMLKKTNYMNIVEAVRKIYKGHLFFESSVSNCYMKSKHSNNCRSLTKREGEVLEEIVKGLSTKEISEKLFITSNTVNTHRKNLLSKLNAKNSTDLVRISIKESLVSI